MKRFCLALAALVLSCAAAGAQIDSAPKVHARLLAESGEVAPGRTVTVALEQNIRAGWHTYWRNPGDAGEPTEIKWTLPAGWRAGPISWPYPQELPVGPLMNYGYAGQPWLLVNITAPADATPGTQTTLRAAASWLVCKEVCIPEDATLTLPLAVSATPRAPDPATEKLFAEARDRLPVVSPWPARFHLGNTLDLYIAAPKLAGLADVTFFPFGQNDIKGIAPQQWKLADNGVVLRLQGGKEAQRLRTLSGVVVLRSQGAPAQALEVSASPGEVPAADFDNAPALGFVAALLFALLGGVILNLMPCVLPILAMKALAIASKAGRESAEAAHEGLAYGAGAVLSFALLGTAAIALRAGGAAIGWGFQLQNPAVVAGFALLVFAIALNLSGVFEIPGVGAGEGLARRGGVPGAFFTGVLAVAVAAPCTAPFMAAALGFALTQPTFTALPVFVALGIGFAAPFTVIGFSPAFLRLLPKPGPWMSVFRQLLAFPMYATALWLVWVLTFETDSGRLVILLAAALALAFALWVIGRAEQSGRAWSRPLAAAAFVLGVAGVAVLLPLLNSGSPARARTEASAIPSEPYSPSRLAELRAERRGAFVDATAAWCVTCLVNEKVALDDARVRTAFRERRVAFLVADWTNRDPAVTDLLATHARSGVPLYLYYAPGAADAVVLPQILTPDAVVSAIGGRQD